MNINEVLGEEVELSALLQCREKRALRQKELIERYNSPIICFTLNIPGPKKDFPLAKKAFLMGFKLIERALKENGMNILYSEKVFSIGGEGYFVVPEDIKKLKRFAVGLEEKKEYGRIFDIDIMDKNGRIDRKDIGLKSRKCLICEKDAKECGRSRSHKIAEVFERTSGLLRQLVYSSYADILSNMCILALLDEVYTTPKPGLVDKNNSGAHSDMNVELFEQSAYSLLPYFWDMAHRGLNALKCENALPELRPVGKEAEDRMLKVTKGVNTHKGAIFSMGIMCFSAGYILGQGRDITLAELQQVCKIVAQPVFLDFDGISEQTAKTAGELLYLKYQDKGVRGEAENGFSSVFEMAYPMYKNLLKEGKSRNTGGVITLLRLISVVRDTNLLKRGGEEGYNWLKAEALSILSRELREDEVIDLSTELDKEASKRNLSPGGCADLLALTYFLDMIVSIDDLIK